MRLGNLPRGLGTQLTLNKWYFCIELRAHPPYMVRCFKPFLFICLVKITDYGEPGKHEGRELKYSGFYDHFVFPWGIVIDII